MITNLTVIIMVAMWQHGGVAKSTNTRFAVAVHVLVYLDGVGRERPVSSDELSSSTNVNPVYVRRVLGPLREAGLVRSRPGAHGGWELAADAERISLADVWRLLQGDDPVLGLHGPAPECPVGRTIQSSLVSIDRGVAAAVERELAGVTIADVTRQGARSPSAQ